MPRVRWSAVFFWCAALAAGSLDPPSFGGAAPGPAAAPGLPGGEHASRRAWQPHSTVGAASCASEPWRVNTSDLTVTAGYLQLLRGCPGSVSGAEAAAPTAQLLVNSTLLRIAPGARVGGNTELCVQSDASLAAGVVDVTGINRAYRGSNADDLRVEPVAGSTKLCQDATLQVSGLANRFADVLTNDYTSVSLSEGRYTLASAVIGMKVIFAGGYTHSADSNNVDIIDVSTRTRTTATLTQGRYGLAGASLRHIAMFFGGVYYSGGNKASNKVDIYNNLTNTWTSTDLATARQYSGSSLYADTVGARARGAATGVGDVIIFAGGRTDTDATLDDIDIYNIVTETWSTATLSEARHMMAAVTVGTMALFAGGGTDTGCKLKNNCNKDNAQSDRVDLYNSADGTWSTASLSVARSAVCGAVHGTKAFFAGGDTTGGTRQSAVVDIYDSATGTWTATEMPTPTNDGGTLIGRTLMAGGASGKAVLFAGGRLRQDIGGEFDHTFVYNVEAGVWSRLEGSSRWGACGATVGDYTVIAGGYGKDPFPTGSTTRVEILKFETQVNVYATVSASSSAGSISGEYRIPMGIGPLGVNISLPTSAITATDHAASDTWTIQCNTTFNGKLSQKLVLGGAEPVCIATNGACPIAKYSTGDGVSYDITNCLRCPARTTTAGVGSTALSDCKCITGYTGPDAGPCQACSSGKYKDAIGSAECTLCPAGKYSDTSAANNSALCLSCPSDAWSASGSTLLTHCVCNAGYTGPDGGTCVACVAGKFKPSNGTAECTQCAAGKYSASTAVATDACADCGRNTYSSQDNTQCVACPQYTHSAVSSSADTDCKCNVGYTGPDGGTCVACVAGKFKPTNGSDTCTLCAAGRYLGLLGATYDKCVQCPRNATSPAGSDVISDCICVPGTTGTAHTESCEPCEAGKFKATAGSADCALCSAGSYSAAGQSACTLCPTGGTSRIGSRNVADCKCNLGYTGPPGQACEACESGKYKDINGTASCSECPVNTTSAEASSALTHCVCIAGHTGDDGTVCSACLEGDYKSATGSAPCANCPLGKISTQSATTSCTTCALGKFSAESRIQCMSCPDYTTSVFPSSRLLDCKCSPGYTGPDGGTCVECAVGKFKSAIGSAVCALCIAGKYSGSTAADSESVCLSCQDGSTSPAGSVANEDCLCNIGYTGPPGTTPCTACAAGKFKSAPGSAACTQCSGGKFVSSEAATSSSDCSDCEINTYSSADNSRCISCTSDSNSPAASSAQTHCQCNLGHTGPNGGPCVACAAGKYKPKEGTAACTQCVGGKHVSSSASTSIDECLACDVNTYSAADNSQCEPCPSHSSSAAMSSVQTACICDPGYSGPNGGSCAACVGGKYKIVAGTAACTLCIGGKYSTATGATSESTCLNCPLHTDAPSGSGDVEDCTCNKGHYGLNGRDCINCAAGTYKDVTGPDPCTLCVSGKYVSVEESVSSSACTNCPAATYSTADRTQCLSCPSDSTSPTSSDEITDCTCNVGYTGPDGGPCTACVAGKYKAAGGSAECTLCGVGKYSTAVGATSVSTCLSCPAATYSSADRAQCLSCPSDSTSPTSSDEITDCTCNAAYTGPDGGPCTACVAGKYKGAGGSAECTLCGVGKYSTAVGATSVSTCLNCAKGKYSVTAGAPNQYECKYCPAFSTSPEGSPSSTACSCNVGYTGADGSRCSACSKGTYKPSTGSSACLQCPIATYNGRTGTSACAECYPGATTLQVGSAIIFDCVCEPGYTGTSNWGVCQQCEKAKYKSTMGSQSCSWCPVNTYTDFFGATACLNCPTHSTNFKVGGLNRSEDRADCKCFPGYSSDGKSVFACNACPAGTWKSIDGPAPCTSCQAGKYSTETASISEDVCRDCPRQSNSPAGSGEITGCTCNPGYTNPPGTNCSKCSAGTYKPAQGAQSCTLCGQGKFSGKVGQRYETTCEPCPRGTLSLAFGAVDNTTCELCPAGTYMPDLGATACLSCPLRSASLPGATSISQCKCAPGYWGPNGLPCNPCAAGKFKENYGTGPCVDCPPNSLSPPGSGRAKLCSCFAGYTGLDESNGWTCVMCAPSTYKNATSNDPCTRCPQSAISQPGSVSKDECFCDVNYEFRGNVCSKCAAGKVKLEIGPEACKFSAVSTLENRTVEAELRLTGLSKDEFISSINDFKKSIADSIISEEDANGLEWGANSVIVIMVCVGSDCTKFVDEGALRRNSGEALSVSYKVSVPKGVSPEALAQTMGDPATVKTFEAKMSNTTGKQVGAEYETPPWVSTANIEEKFYVPFLETPAGISVIWGVSLLLFACAIYLWLQASIPRIFKAYWKNARLKPLPAAHFSILLQRDPDNFSDDILCSGLAHDLSTATGLKSSRILIVSVAAQSTTVGGSKNKGEKCALAQVHLIDCGESEVQSLVLDLITQSRDLQSSLMIGKWTRWTKQINDEMVDNGQVSESYEIQELTAGKKSAIKDFETLHALRRWTRKSSCAKQETREYSGEIGPSLGERDGPGSTFLLSGFDFNHMTMDKRVFFDDPTPKTDQGLHAEKLRALLKEAESLTADLQNYVPADDISRFKVEYEVNIEPDAQGQPLGLGEEIDPEPYAKSYRPGILKALTLKQEPLAGATAKPSFLGGFSFVKQSSTLENEDFHDRAGSHKKRSLYPVSWEGIAKEREFQRMWEENDNQAVELIDESEFDDVVRRLASVNSVTIAPQPVATHAAPSGVSEIRDLMKSLEDEFEADGKQQAHEVEPEPYLPSRSMGSEGPADGILPQVTEEELALVEPYLSSHSKIESSQVPAVGIPHQIVEEELALVDNAMDVRDEAPEAHLRPSPQNQEGSGRREEFFPIVPDNTDPVRVSPGRSELSTPCASEPVVRTSPSLLNDGASHPLNYEPLACIPQEATSIEPRPAQAAALVPPGEFGLAVEPARSVPPRPDEHGAVLDNFGANVSKAPARMTSSRGLPMSFHPSSQQIEDGFAPPAIPTSRPMTGLQEFGTTGTPSETGPSAPASARSKVRFRDQPPSSQRSKRGPGPLTKRLTFSRPSTMESKKGEAMHHQSRPSTQGTAGSALDVGWAHESSLGQDQLSADFPSTPRTLREHQGVRFVEHSEQLVLGSPRERPVSQHANAGSRPGTAALILAAKLKLENSARYSNLD